MKISTLLAGLGAVLLGAATVAVAHAATDGPGDEDVPPDKAAVLAQPTQPLDLSTVKIGSLADPTKDQGDPAAIQAVKEQVLALQLAEQEVQELPLDLDQREKVVADPSAIEARSNTIRTVYAAKLADWEVADYQKALELVADDNTYEPYQRVEVVLNEWQGVQVDGDHATAQFVSQYKYWSDGDKAKGGLLAGKVQWQITLVREGDTPFGGWRIETEAGIPLEMP